MSVCDSSSETEDEWASSLGTAGAIFSCGLYNRTGGGGVLCVFVCEQEGKREGYHKANQGQIEWNNLKGLDG